MQKLLSERAGKLRKQPTGYMAFIPANLPPTPPIDLDVEMQTLLSAADRKLGRLDGITEVLPNPELFLAMYVQKEALLSSQIEGTQASLTDVLDFSDEYQPTEKRAHVEDVVNYVKAVNYGLKRLDTLPMSLRLLREIHEILLQGVRGSDRNPGEFRRSQNWIGAPGCTLENAVFVPPPETDMLDAMSALELYFYDESYIPSLIKIALIHAQFETIHPFLDGNGRMGRLLITFWLCQQKILSRPLLYLSYYFKQNRSEYYEKLMNVRLRGDWESWIKFFLQGIADVSDEAVDSARKILDLKDSCTAKVNSMGASYPRLVNLLFEKPIITRKEVAESLCIGNNTAGDLLKWFCEQSILIDATPDRQRNKKFRFQEYLAILEKGTETVNMYE